MIRRMWLPARMILEPPAENGPVRTIPVVTVEDEFCEGVSTMDSADVLAVE